MGIRLELLLADNLEQSRVDASGFEIAPVSDEIANGFGLPRQVLGYHESIWACVNNWWGRPPNHFWLSDPLVNPKDVHGVSGNWNMYADSGRADRQVRAEKKAVGARLLSVSGKPDAIATREYANHLQIPTPEELERGVDNIQTFSSQMSRSIAREASRTSEHNWSLGMEQEISAEVGGDSFGFKVGRRMNFTFGTGGSKSTTHATSEEQAISDSAEIKVPPQETYVASLVAGLGSMQVEVDYDVTLVGEFAVWYQRPLNGESLYLGSINGIIEWLGLTNPMRVKEVLDIGFVTDGKITVGEKA